MAQDRYLTLQTTPAGMNMIIRTLYGDSITFTKMAVGNGRPEDLDNVTDLENPLLEIPLTDMDDHDDYLVLTGSATSSDIASSFYGNELGVYAEDDNGDEHLYAYRYSETDVDFFPASNSGRTLELTLSVVVQLGNAENVTAILIEGDAYAKKEDFEAHLANDDNPHQVTKSQVGLGNVPNVSTNDQTPTYTMAGALANLVSGETLTAAMAKIAKAVSSLISHLSANNPHSITPAKIGAATTSHTHSVADINSGTLGVARGGTGASNAAEACANLGAERAYMKMDAAGQCGIMYTSGLLINWGMCSAPAGNSNPYTVNFAYAFKDTNYAVMAVAEGVNSTVDVTIRVQRTGRDSFTARCFNDGAPSHTIQATYIAVGFWK